MQYWTNTAQNPSNFEIRSDKDIAQWLKQNDLPECGVSAIRHGMASEKQLKFTLTHEAGYAGPWEFHPVVNMSYGKGDQTNTQATMLDPSVEYATGKYIPIHCGPVSKYVAYFPNCGNLSEVVIKETNISYDGGNCVIQKTNEEFHTVPLPGTVALVLLGFALIKFFRK